MKKYKFLLIVGLFTQLFAADWPTKPSSYVTDLAGVIEPAVKIQIENLLTELERKTSAEVAVVTLKGLEGQDVNEAANQLFKQWGVGKKGKDNGVLFLISPSDRKARIEVGYGLEGILPDGTVGRLMDQNVIPDFRAGDFSAGILKGTAAIALTIAHEAGVSLQSTVPPLEMNQPLGEPTIGQKLFAIFVLVFIVFILLRHPWLIFFFMRGGGGGGFSSGGGFGGGFSGFGGGGSGGGGASRGW